MEEYSKFAKGSTVKKEDDVKPVEKVISGKATKKKKNRLKEEFNFDWKEIAGYVGYSVALPAFKKLMSTVFKTAVDMVFGSGDSYSSSSLAGSSSVKPVPYYEYGSRSRSYSSPSYRSLNKTRIAEDILIDSEAEAQDLVTAARERIANYGCCSVDDLYTMAGIPGSYNDRNWGWKSVRDINYRRIPDGRYLIELAPVCYLD